MNSSDQSFTGTDFSLASKKIGTAFAFRKLCIRGGRHFPCNEADDKQLGGIDYDTESYFHHRIRFSGGIVSV
jgi:hypothetical protein